MKYMKNVAIMRYLNYYTRKMSEVNCNIFNLLSLNAKFRAAIFFQQRYVQKIILEICNLWGRF